MSENGTNYEMGLGSNTNDDQEGAPTDNEIVRHDSEELSLKEEVVPDEERLCLAWKGIKVQTVSKKNCGKHVPPRELIHGVDGVVKPGSLMALMGASGAGKTTLLNVINFRSGQGLHVSGEITINGHPVDQRIMSKVSVFVQQQDVCIGTLTVREHLMFHARLSLRNESSEQIKTRVEEVMQAMSLTKCQNVLIGSEKLKLIPGNIRRRTEKTLLCI